jgi:uncharacterized protein (TIGR01244 family)
MARASGLFLSAALFLQCGAGARPKHAEFPDIANFLRIDSQVCTGGQPTLDDLARMKDEGVRAVLNLRRPEEFKAAEEAAKAQSLGLRYFLIPVDTKHPRDEQAEEFLKILADPQNRPIFIHCHSANRVGAFWMIRRVLVDGWSFEDAEHEANKIGLRGKELRRFARDYLRRHSKNPA